MASGHDRHGRPIASVPPITFGRTKSIFAGAIMRQFRLFGILSLAPAMLGSIPVGAAAPLTMELSLCGGGKIEVPFDPEAPMRPAMTPCCAKGCQSRGHRSKQSAART